MTLLEVRDHGDPVSISFADLLKYHGRRSIGGVAHGFKVMERALPLLAGGEPPERTRIQIDSAFPGDGTRDAFEMVTRAVTGGRHRLVPELAPARAPEGPEGRFWFRVRYGRTTVEVTLRQGFVSADFVAAVRRGAATPEEEAALTRMKEAMAEQLMALPAGEVYDAETAAAAEGA